MMNLIHLCASGDLLIAHLQELLVPLLAGGGSAGAALHLSDLALQLDPGPLAVPEPALGISQPQQLLLQETVLPLQQGQLPDGGPRRDLCTLRVPPGQASQGAPGRHGHGVVGLQQQLQDGVLLDDGSLEDTRRFLQKTLLAAPLKYSLLV